MDRLIVYVNTVTGCGRALNFDPSKEQIADHVQAGALLTREYRDHWARPVG
jgi:hypothetical protein